MYDGIRILYRHTRIPNHTSATVQAAGNAYTGFSIKSLVRIHRQESYLQELANVCTVMSGNMQLADLDTDTYTKEASCIPSNLKIYEIILPNTIY